MSTQKEFFKSPKQRLETWKSEASTYIEIGVLEGNKIENWEDITFKEVFPTNVSELMNAQIPEHQRQ